MSHHKQTEHHVRPYKILAQSVGLIVCGFFLLFIIGEGIPDLFNKKSNELYWFLPMVLLPIAGYVVTWKKEKTGAMMMIAGSILLLVYLLIKQNVSAAFIYCIPFLVSGGLFVLHIKKRNELLHKK
ncbi:MAG: hypothetical protein JST86_21125 [Bacteroidetes bacterium]|nr:hypothetical protein [Bacteroidota bacterium]